ncbi:DUF4142 domain-containing protein [Sphingomonas sp. DT-204]|uniref:DUF4142 domain-containing protein n=1 Tax=Sphingomonas sp. DT-204 TaxID=3396166 RepID=UPI003F1A61EC
MLRSGDARIRNFANMMIRDHTKSTADVKAAARAAGLRAPAPRLNREQSRNIATLRAARGAQRDRLYLQQQRIAHRQALELHRGYARSGAVRSLRVTAGQIAPVVQHHIAMLSRM